MYQDSKATLARLERFVRERITPAIYRDSVELSISAWQAPREPVSFEHATGQKFEPVGLGWRFGRAWSTIWLKVSGQIPPGWDSQAEAELAAEILIDFGYNTSRSGFQAEALAYDKSGLPIKSIAPKNSWLPWSYAEKQIDFYLEVAANPDVAGEYDFEPTNFGDWDTAPETPLYELKQLHLARRNKSVWELWQDIWSLQGLINSLPEVSTRRHALLRAIEDMLDNIDPVDVAGSAQSARAMLQPVLSSPASASSHRVIATGHAHIDSAWLWPIRETVRKCARTFSNVLNLMQDHPDFVFSASSAQHYSWIKENYPAVFAQISERVATGQWQPVGGMWVECDGNMPGSEAMVRQFVLGQKFFMDNFGLHSKEAWLPDSFGYSAALPQIVSQSGISSFLSQKMSWNQVNKMPHHSFWWEGLDGSRVFTHFPSADTYISELSGEELAHAETNFAEKGRGTVSLVPFGWGDGGGGPTREMIAAAHRTANLEGSPRVQLGSAQQFFDQARQEYQDAPVWRGEMYLELHRGVLTSQHRTKHGNRRNEALLREAELWASYAYLKRGLAYPAAELNQIWESILLMQFHDILPGTAIAWVYREVELRHAEISQALTELIERSLSALANDADSAAPKRALHANSRPTANQSVGALAIGVPEHNAESVTASQDMGLTVLENQDLKITIDPAGRISSLFDKQNQRESIHPAMPANEFQLHNDIPTLWDAWDVDVHYLKSKLVLDQIDSLSVSIGDFGQATVETRRTISSPGRPNSVITQRLILEPGSRDLLIEIDVDWHESEKFLKLAFPVDVHAERVASETQFGHVFRPTHANTSWDYARFETCQHRYLHVGEQGWGIAFANDSTYGYDAQRTSEISGATVTNVRFSLLRAPRFPDPETDQGLHQMRFSIRPGATIQDAVNLGYQLAFPSRELVGNAALPALVCSAAEQVIIDAVKLAEDGSGDLIVRIYESIGSRTNCRISFAGVAQRIELTNLLEQALQDSTATQGSQIDLDLRPFQVITMRVAGLKL
jgi:alpha-mannosidase